MQGASNPKKETAAAGKGRRYVCSVVCTVCATAFYPVLSGGESEKGWYTTHFTPWSGVISPSFAYPVNAIHSLSTLVPTHYPDGPTCPVWLLSPLVFVPLPFFTSNEWIHRTTAFHTPSCLSFLLSLHGPSSKQNRNPPIPFPARRASTHYHVLISPRPLTCLSFLVF
jgi:hypothetical protein